MANEPKRYANGEAQAILNIACEDVIEMLIAGDTYRVIADKYKVSLGTLNTWITTSEHSPRAKEAIRISAAAYYDKAEEEIRAAMATGDHVQVQGAKLLSDLYTKKAGKRNPKEYGDKLDIVTDGESLKPIDTSEMTAEQKIAITAAAKAIHDKKE